MARRRSSIRRRATPPSARRRTQQQAGGASPGRPGGRALDSARARAGFEPAKEPDVRNGRDRCAGIESGAASAHRKLLSEEVERPLVPLMADRAAERVDGEREHLRRRPIGRQRSRVGSRRQHCRPDHRRPRNDQPGHDEWALILVERPARCQCSRSYLTNLLACVASEHASEPREWSAPSKRRARERVGESEGRSPSDKARLVPCVPWRPSRPLLLLS